MRAARMIQKYDKKGAAECPIDHRQHRNNNNNIHKNNNNNNYYYYKLLLLVSLLSNGTLQCLLQTTHFSFLSVIYLYAFTCLCRSWWNTLVVARRWLRH